MKVLVACEFSGIVRDAFRAAGHDAYSCDLLPTESDPAHHFQDDALKAVKFARWDLLIAHPPCTYLANSGVRWLHEREGRWQKMSEAAVFFAKLQHQPIPRIAIENPIIHRYAKAYVGRQTQTIQPWQFGHGETKAICLWLKNLPPLEPTDVVDGREARVHKEPPGPDRWKNRSRFYPGIAKAMAEQWGC